MSWVIASDHGGIKLKSVLKKCLESEGYQVDDLGGFDFNADDKYAENADDVVSKILSGEAQYGVLVCGTGIGISMRANRYAGIRAALITNEFTAKSCKAHNNANIACFGERVTSPELAVQCLKEFINTEYEGGRHDKRVDAIDAPVK